MSIRITNDQTNGVASSQTARTELSPSSASGGQKARGRHHDTSADQISVSSVTEAIVAGVSTHGVRQSGKVSQLSALYASGKYEIDSVAVSRALVSGALDRTSNVESGGE